MGFVKKIEIFPSFYLRQNKPGKCVSRYSTEEIVFLDYKNKTELDKVGKLALFSKGLVHGFG